MRLLLIIFLIVGLLNCKGDDKPIEKQVDSGPKMPESGCVVEQSTRLVNERKVGTIQNLVEDKVVRGYENQCTVNFDLEVDGVTYHLEETEVGLYQMPVICYDAKERARGKLLQELGGTFKAESIMLCRQVDK